MVLKNILPPFSKLNLKMEAVCYAEAFSTAYTTIRCYSHRLTFNFNCMAPQIDQSVICKYMLTAICKKIIYELNLWYVDENQSGQTNDTVSATAKCSYTAW